MTVKPSYKITDVGNLILISFSTFASISTPIGSTSANGSGLSSGLMLEIQIRALAAVMLNFSMYYFKNARISLLSPLLGFVLTLTHDMLEDVFSVLMTKRVEESVLKNRL